MEESKAASECTEEIKHVRERYQRRMTLHEQDLYNRLLPSVYMSQQEKERALIKLITEAGLMPVDDKSVLEVGCGSGGNLLKLIELGFDPGKLIANEILEERVQAARKRLPQVVRVIPGDATELNLPPESFDIVLQSLVFTSLLDIAVQHRLADKMWQLTKPSGGIVWYDFVYNNPSNPDVRGVSVKRIKELFPQGSIKIWRVTLAPPISRRVTRFNPLLYSVLNLLPFLRTHVLCWIEKS